jgi:hypothetical protein
VRNLDIHSLADRGSAAAIGEGMNIEIPHGRNTSNTGEVAERPKALPC